MVELFTRVSLEGKVHAGDRRDRRVDIPIFPDMTGLLSAYIGRKNKYIQVLKKPRINGNLPYDATPRGLCHQGHELLGLRYTSSKNV